MARIKGSSVFLVSLKREVDTIFPVLHYHNSVWDAHAGDDSFTIEQRQREMINACKQNNVDLTAIKELAKRSLSKKWFCLYTVEKYRYKDKNGSYNLPEDFIDVFSLITSDAPNTPRKLTAEELENFNTLSMNETSSTMAKFWQMARPILHIPEEYVYVDLGTLETLLAVLADEDEEKIITWEPGRLAPYSPMPNAPALLFVARVINNAKPRQYPPTSTAESIRFFASSSTNEVKIVHETRNSRETVTLMNPEILTGRRRGETRSIFSVWTFALQKLMQQSSGKSLPDYVQIDLQEMVNLKMYSSVDNAYRAIVTMIQKTGTMHISQDFKTGKGKKRNVGGYLFTSHVRDDYKAKVYINKLFGFEYYARQYFYFPGWCYQLNETSFPVAYYVFSLARQNAVNLTDKGKFEIKLSTLHTFLGLRTVDDVREHGNYRYNDYIKSPIIQAVDEINAAAKKDKTIKGKFKLTLKVPESGSIDSWLEGSIVVSAGGEYIEHLESIAEYQTLRTEAFQDAQKEKKRQKVIAAAQAAAEKN